MNPAQLLVPITSVAGTSEIREGLPKVLEFTEVMYLPTYGRPGPWGIFDAQGAAIEGTVNFLGPGRHPMLHQSVTVIPQPAEATCNEPDLVYVGEIMNHFGHFLTQTLSRFWYLRERPSARLLFHSMEPKAQLFSIPHVAQTFEALGLREEQFVRFEVPTLVQRVTVPQPSFEEMHFAHQIYAECLREIGAFFTQGDVVADEGPLYLSKARIGRGVQRLVNEQEMEDEFARQGVRIVHPETLSLPQQIDILRRHRTLLGCCGSHFHSTPLLPEGRRIVGLNCLENLSSNFLMVDKLIGNKASYYYAPSTKEITKEIADPKFIFMRTFRIDDPVDVARELLQRIGDEGRDLLMAVEISGVTQCPSDDLITGACLDYPRTGPVDGYAFDARGWVVSTVPVAEVEFVHEQSVVASCELNEARPDVAEVYGSSSQVGFWKAIRTVGFAPDFTIEVRVVFQDGRRRQIAEIRGTQQLTSAFPGVGGNDGNGDTGASDTTGKAGSTGATAAAGTGGAGCGQ